MLVNSKSLYAGFLFLASGTLSAQIIDSYNTTSETGETIVHRTVSITDPDTGEPVLVHQTLRKNPDGTLTTVPGSRSPKLKAIHKKICEKRGGVDITDKTNSSISPATSDSVICNIPLRKTPTGNEPKNKRDKTHTSSQLLPASGGSGLIYTISAPPNIHVHPRQNFNISGKYTYAYYGFVQYTNALTVDNCSTTHNGYYGGEGESGTGRTFVYLLCSVLPDTVPTSFVSTINACVGNDCKSNNG